MRAAPSAHPSTRHRAARARATPATTTAPRPTSPRGARARRSASAGNFPDALAAAPLAAAVGGPVLLNPTEGLAPVVAEELERLGARRVVVMGGVQAQSAAVADAVTALTGVTVERVAGPDRSATAAAAAERAVQEWDASGIEGAGEEVLVASGAGFPDALAAGPLAAAAHRPLLLVGEDDVPAATAAALEALGTRRVTVVGGTAVVGAEVAATLARDHDVERLAGESRFATAAAVADAAIAAGADPDVVLVASGGTFPDALAAGPAAGARGGVLLLTGGDELAGVVGGHVRDRGARLEWVAVAGGTSVISDAVVAELRAAAGGS